MHIISLGAGVQSTTMALMAAHGEITPMPDCAIFADTGWEPAHVYKHLEWLIPQLPFPVHIVKGGNIHDDAIAGFSECTKGQRFPSIPWFVINPDGSNGIGRRQCTAHYKIEPLHRKERELLGVGRRGHMKKGAIEKWLGISVDEVIRATPNRLQYEINRFPLIEQRMSRGDCIEWLKRHDYPVPSKSACIGCPFHDNASWRDLRSRPDEWKQAVEMDKAIRDQTWRGFKGQQFMHRDCVPLDQVDLSTAEDRGQLNLFINECEGMCGV
jgi:hypothetical protein